VLQGRVVTCEVAVRFGDEDGDVEGGFERLVVVAVRVVRRREASSGPGPHPTSTHTYMGMQQPPPKLSEHLTKPRLQLSRLPTQSLFGGQQPTSPRPVSGIMLQDSPLLQQVLGRPMAEQSEEPRGHWKARLARG
jgi:hypothetical protein